MSQTISGCSTVALATGQVTADLAGELVILHLRSGVYYSLDPVGTRIWRLMEEPTTVAALRDAILAEYEVENDRCERELLALLEELAARELIEIRDGSAH
jgi:Coenzyme PQQ synthesis protein D (PqqD)